ncbi:hypothetical protein BDK51DRAFT_24446, partial [Blyttiomyces helicus]
FRHPSYTAFFYWGVSLQLMLGNPICTLIFIAALHRFFSKRIEYEEATLEGFFGQHYRDYRKKTGVYIPFF